MSQKSIKNMIKIDGVKGGTPPPPLKSKNQCFLDPLKPYEGENEGAAQAGGLFCRFPLYTVPKTLKPSAIKSGKVTNPDQGIRKSTFLTFLGGVQKKCHFCNFFVLFNCLLIACVFCFFSP